MIFFITNAMAEGGSAQQSGGLMSFLPMIAIIGVLYFLLIRPQQKRAKQHQELLSKIKKGDKVITNSGIVATVSKILNEQEIILEIADGVQCKFIKSTIATVLDKNSKTDESPKKIEAPKKKESSAVSKKESEEKQEDNS